MYDSLYNINILIANLVGIWAFLYLTSVLLNPKHFKEKDVQ